MTDLLEGPNDAAGVVWVDFARSLNVWADPPTPGWGYGYGPGWRNPTRTRTLLYPAAMGTRVRQPVTIPKWASREHPVKSTFHLYCADNCSFLIIDLAGGPSKDNSGSGGRYTADRDQCNTHRWHIQDVLQKDLRCLLLSIR